MSTPRNKPRIWRCRPIPSRRNRGKEWRRRRLASVSGHLLCRGESNWRRNCLQSPACWRCRCPSSRRGNCPSYQKRDFKKDYRNDKTWRFLVDFIKFSDQTQQKNPRCRCYRDQKQNRYTRTKNHFLSSIQPKKGGQKNCPHMPRSELYHITVLLSFPLPF